MKSIIEQASSIIKAIEKAWIQAEKPKEFSIKIFETEEKNFFGITTKPAKVGIFFGEKNENKFTASGKSVTKPHAEIKECRPEPQPRPRIEKIKQVEQAHTQQISPSNHSAQPKPKEAVTSAVAHEGKKKEEQKKYIPAVWSEAMINSVSSWLKTTLELMGMNSIQFTYETAGKNLKLMFNAPLVANPFHEKQLFRSFAHLIMSSLRNQYKQEIRDLRVILISNKE